MTVLKHIATFFSPRTLLEISGGVVSFDYVKDTIIELSQSKLRDDGEDSEGKRLRTDFSVENIGGGIYSPNNEKNFSQDFVDLYKSGDFYRSFDIITKKTFFELKANFKKGSENIYNNFQASYSDFDTFENMILGLQEKDLDIFIEKVFLPQAIQLFIKKVTDAI